MGRVEKAAEWVYLKKRRRRGCRPRQRKIGGESNKDRWRKTGSVCGGARESRLAGGNGTEQYAAASLDFVVSVGWLVCSTRKMSRFNVFSPCSFPRSRDNGTWNGKEDEKGINLGGGISGYFYLVMVGRYCRPKAPALATRSSPLKAARLKRILDFAHADPNRQRAARQGGAWKTPSARSLAR